MLLTPPQGLLSWADFNNPSALIGIRTATPDDALDVNGQVVFGALTERLSMGSGSLGFNRKIATGAIYDNTHYAYQWQHTGNAAPASDYLALQVYEPDGDSVVTAYALVVDGNGRVAINMTPSLSNQFEVRSADVIGICSKGTVNGPSGLINIANTNVATSWNLGVETGAGWASGPAGTLYFDKAGVGPQMALTPSGNLAIGSSIPSQGRLWVAGGDIWINSSTGALCISTDGSTDSTPNVKLAGSGNDLLIGQWSGSTFRTTATVAGASGNLALLGAITQNNGVAVASVTSGSYTGNDTSNRAIPHGLGVTPKVVFIFALGGTTGLLRIYDDRVYFVSSGADSSLVTTSWTSTNFYVGNAGSYAQSANANLQDYAWVAIG